MNKVKKVMSEYKHGELHSGSKRGPVVTSRKQAIAIGMSEARKAKGKALAKKSGKLTREEAVGSRKKDFTGYKQGNFMKVHKLDRC